MTRPIDRGFLLKRIWRVLARNYLEQQANGSQLRSWKGRTYGLREFLPRKCCFGLMALIARSSRIFLPSAPSGKSLGIPGDERLILFLGRLIPRKGADLLIEALPHIGGDKYQAGHRRA